LMKNDLPERTYSPLIGEVLREREKESGKF